MPNARILAAALAAVFCLSIPAGAQSTTAMQAPSGADGRWTAVSAATVKTLPAAIRKAAHKPRRTGLRTTGKKRLRAVVSPWQAYDPSLSGEYPPRSVTPGVVRSLLGHTAKVAKPATAALQCVVNGLEDGGYAVRIMGGYAARPKNPHSLHPAGKALDVNQERWGVTVPPMPRQLAHTVAQRCNVVSGGDWDSDDLGHFNLKPRRAVAASQNGRRYAASRHRVRLAWHRPRG